MPCKQKMHTVIKWDEPHMTLLKKKGWWTLEYKILKCIIQLSDLKVQIAVKLINRQKYQICNLEKNFLKKEFGVLLN